jgi:D-sedoheptulose 7-phosphate isomerase
VSAADGPFAGIALHARSSELHAVIASAQVSDASGKSLDTEESLRRVVDMLRDLRQRRGNLYLIGNGGSASVASHSMVDFVNVAGIRAATLHEPSLLTCMTNDYGHAEAFARILSIKAGNGDMLIAISSSGNSPNIRNAAAAMLEIGGTVVTFSGFEPDNPLRRLGGLNLWLDSRDYGMVEIGHQFILHNLADRLRIENDHGGFKP